MTAPILPNLKKPRLFGNMQSGSFWVEYPSGLLDLTRNHPPEKGEVEITASELEFSVDGNRRVRVDPKQSAVVIVDMQNFFLHPDLLEHPRGLECVQPLIELLPSFRKAGIRIIWLNWGLTPKELSSLPPALVRSFTRAGEGGFGCDLGGNWGPALMRGTPNADLYGPLKDEWLKGKEAGTDVWFHKNRVGGLWGPGTPLGLYLREEGINTLFFAGVNTDQCVLGTLVDAYFNGYDSILIKDATATTSPGHGYDGALYNTELLYGFVTDSQRILTQS